jgi:hypothetical protein
LSKPLKYLHQHTFSHKTQKIFQMADCTKDGIPAHLSTLQSLRGTGTQDAAFSQHLLIVKRWQSALH